MKKQEYNSSSDHPHKSQPSRSPHKHLDARASIASYRCSTQVSLTDHASCKAPTLPQMLIAADDSSLKSTLATHLALVHDDILRGDCLTICPGALWLAPGRQLSSTSLAGLGTGLAQHHVLAWHQQHSRLSNPAPLAGPLQHTSSSVTRNLDAAGSAAADAAGPWQLQGTADCCNWCLRRCHHDSCSLLLLQWWRLLHAK